MRYVQATNTGKGFITHADQALLSFKGWPNSMWQINGATGDEDTWIARVSGVEKTLQESQDLVFAVTRFYYTSREFLVENLTPNEVKFLLENYDTYNVIKNLVDHVLDEGGINVGSTRFLTFINAVKDAGHLTQTRVDEITAGRSA